MDKTSVQKFNGNSRDEKLITKKKKKSKISNCNQNFDEIEVLHSETITLSPIKINLNTISKSPPSGGKSKWSFKIKLQSDQPQNEFLETSGELQSSLRESRSHEKLVLLYHSCYFESTCSNIFTAQGFNFITISLFQQYSTQ